MKKTTKKILVGAGLAVAGLIVYSAWKDSEKPVVVQHTNGGTGSTTPTKEYVEHRRQQIREAAEVMKATPEEAPVAEIVEPPAVEESQEEVPAPPQEIATHVTERTNEELEG